MGRNRLSIRDPEILGEDALTNAQRVKFLVDRRLVSEKRDQIRQLVKDLKYGGAISGFEKLESEKSRVLEFELGIGNQALATKFIIWTGPKEPDYVDYFNSVRKQAQFVIRVSDNIKDLEQRVLACIESTDKGRATEFLAMTALDRLRRGPVGDIKLKYFRGIRTDEKNILVSIIHDGWEKVVPIQCKSSKEKLMEHKEKYPRIPGFFRVFTGDEQEEVEIIQEKILRIIDAYVQGKVIFI